MKKTSPVLRAAETVMRVLLTACGLAAVGFVIVITGYLVVSGIPAIREVGLIEFLAGTVWKPSTDQFGILPVILTSVLGTFGAILIGVPLGLLFAIYLGKMAPKPVYQVLRPTVDLLSGIPSVVYGLVGMMVLVPFVREAFHVADGVGLFSSIIVLTVMVLPSIISVSETALKAVPREYEEASLALGATWNETAMAIMMVCGNVANMPSLFSSVRFLTTAIAGEMSYSSGLHRQALFSVALILYCFIMLINMVLNFFLKKKEK